MLAFKRGKRRYIADYKVRDIYDEFKKKYPQLDMSQTIFTNILKDLNCEKIVRIVAEGDELFFPYRLGSMRIRKRKMKLKVVDGKLDKTKMPVRWADTKKMWEKKYPNLTAEEIAAIPNEEKGFVYNWNEHTDMYKFRFFWDKLTCNYKNKTFYLFKPTRNAAQFVTRLLKEDNNIQYKYFE